MTTTQAKSFLTDAKYTIKTVELELFDNDGYVDDYTVTAGEDCIEAAKAKKLAQLKKEFTRLYGTHNGLY